MASYPDDAEPKDGFLERDSGDAPMTEEQIEMLKALSLQTNDPQAFSTTLTRAEAEGRIKMLEAALAR